MLVSDRIRVVVSPAAMVAGRREDLLAEADRVTRNDRSRRALENLRQVLEILDIYGVAEYLTIDLGEIRGLGYHTGVTFEGFVAGVGEPVCSGGRYDDLVSRFSPMQLSGVGTSVGIDRLIAALDELGLSHAEAAVARVAVLDFEPTCRDAVLSLTSTLRDSGIATALYLGNDDNLRGQLAWAVKGGFPFVVIMGANELAKGVVQLKDMSARTQTETPINELPTRLK